MRISINAECSLRIQDVQRDIMFVVGAGATTISHKGISDLLLYLLTNGDITGVDDQVNNQTTGFFIRLYFTNDGLNELMVDVPPAKTDAYETDLAYVYDANSQWSGASVSNTTGNLYLVRASLFYRGTIMNYDQNTQTYSAQIQDIELVNVMLDRNPFSEDITIIGTTSPQYTKGIKVVFDGQNNVSISSTVSFSVPKTTY